MEPVWAGQPRHAGQGETSQDMAGATHVQPQSGLAGPLLCPGTAQPLCRAQLAACKRAAGMWPCLVSPQAAARLFALALASPQLLL